MRASPMWRPLASRDLAEAGLQQMSASYARTWRRLSSGLSPDVGLASCFRFLVLHMYPPPRNEAAIRRCIRVYCVRLIRKY